jgi:long-chain acyl-CoA synthetase
MNIAELNLWNIKEYGEYVSLIFEDREYTNVEMDKLACRLANALKGLGVKPGERLAMMMGNSAEVLITFQAAYKLGAWVMPILFVLQPEEIAHILDDSEAEVCLVHGLFLPKLLEAQKLTKKGALKHIITADQAPMEGYPHFYELTDAHKPEFDVHPAKDDDVAYLMYTSGTTGLPKGVMLSNHGVYFVAKTCTEILGFKHEDFALGVLPMNHSFGISASVSCAISGAASAMLSWFDAGKALEYIEKYKCTSTGIVPTMMALMLNHEAAESTDTSTMRTWVVGAAPLPLEIYHQFEKTFSGKVVEAYGMTESSPGGTMNRPGIPYKAGSAGPPIPGIELKIFDEEGNELPPNTPGEICMKGPHVMKGYYKKPEVTAQTITDGWLHSGDVGFLDDDGYLFITERIKDMIIRGGENIYPRDIEEVLFEHPKILEASVVGKKHPVYGEDVLAVVVLRPGEELTEEEVIEYAGRRLAKFQKPKWVVFVDSLPKNPVGKVLKRELRAQYGQQD